MGREQQCISTHALTEGDTFQLHELCYLIISTHALTEGDNGSGSPARNKELIISTHALTEGDISSDDEWKDETISTHALTEGDNKMFDATVALFKFQLTPSRRATTPSAER